MVKGTVAATYVRLATSQSHGQAREVRVVNSTSGKLRIAAEFYKDHHLAEAADEIEQMQRSLELAKNHNDGWKKDYSSIAAQLDTAEKAARRRARLHPQLGEPYTSV